MNRLERFYRIHELLKEAQKPVSMQRFISELGVRRTTVSDDFAYMRDFLGAPIVYDRSANGHYYDSLAPVFELPGLWLNESELYALLACEQLLEEAQPGLMVERLRPLRSRIDKLLHEKTKNHEAIGRRIRIQPMHSRWVGDEVFLPVSRATLSRRKLSFSYYSRGRNATSQRTVSPQHLINYRHNWYLLAYCHQAEDLRMFSLDVMQAPKLEIDTAKTIDDKELTSFYGAGFGIFTGPVTHTAKLKFNAASARWAADEQWHPEQKGYWKGDSYYLQVPYSHATELIMEILRYGSGVEVMSPPNLRHEVAKTIREMQAIYN